MTRVAIDVGGTFTDCLVLDASGALHAYKAPTTSGDPSRGLLDALAKAADAEGKSLAELVPELEMIIHGTTLATNALLTSRGAKVGMLTTRGFRDVVEARRGQKGVDTSMYNLFVPPYRPLVPRSRRLPVTERIVNDGSVAIPLDETDTQAAIERLAVDGVEAIAICFLHSYANGAHEARVEEICQQRFDGSVYLTTSHTVVPIWGEYERFNTTVVGAYVGPIVSRYLERLEAQLAGLGFGGSLFIVQTDGLMQSAAASRRRAVALVNSGPAAAPTGALRWGSTVGADNLISIDMGGTSFDVCLIQGGEIPTTTEGWVGDERIAIKMVDNHIVGAGGGSIAWIDALGLLRVGPQSAGADPGPACYGRGGTEPTVTDADVVLGYVPTDYFLGGEIPLDGDRAKEAMRQVGAPLGLDETQAAAAIFRSVNAFMADQITEISTKRGLDIRDFALVVGGGAGPVHAAEIAHGLEIQTVIIPKYSALYSAFGMFEMEIGREFVRSYTVGAREIDLDHLASLYDELEREAIDELRASHVDPGEITFTRMADMRYRGQYHPVEVGFGDVPRSPADIDGLVDAFQARHRELYTFDLPFRDVEFMLFRLRASVKRLELALPTTEPGQSDPAAALKRTRRCHFDGEWVDTPCYAGERLQPGNAIAGPALIEEATTTVLVPRDFTCVLDPAQTYILRRS